MAAEPVTVDPELRPTAALERTVGERYGLSLRKCTPEGLAQRLRFRIQERVLDGVESYAEYLLYGNDRDAWEDLAETLTANESRVFEPPGDFAPLFELGSDPRWSRFVRPGSGRFRCLSAGCGTGEEAYSLAIALAEARARAPAFDFEVIGADLSTTAVARARRAVYSASRVEALPGNLRQAYLQERDGTVSAEPLRPYVRFARINLCERDALSSLGEFDLVFARGFLSALTPEGRASALTHLAGALRPGGVLLLGPVESIGEPELGLLPIRWGDRYAYEKPVGPEPPAGSPERASKVAPDEDAIPEPKRALLAHRSALVRAWMRILLEQHGYTVEEAPDGLRALERAVMGRPRALYVLELTLPSQGGPWVCERLKALGALADRSVLYLSPRGSGGDEGPISPAGARASALPLSSRELEAALSSSPL